MVVKNGNGERELIDVPSMTTWETIKDIPNRLVSMVWKLVGFSGVLLGIAVWLRAIERLGDYPFVVLCIVAVFGKKGLDWIKELKR